MRLHFDVGRKCPPEAMFSGACPERAGRLISIGVTEAAHEARADATANSTVSAKE